MLINCDDQSGNRRRRWHQLVWLLSSIDQKGKKTKPICHLPYSSSLPLFLSLKSSIIYYFGIFSLDSTYLVDDFHCVFQFQM